ncbi:MAG TPA: transcriptional regulator, partial [Bacteroidetes bacterium]|nr:transcriptional regulator [Bacteroidota bacterium]
KVFENRIRLAIMSLLMVQDHLDFNALKSTLALTDGNLASHIHKLEGMAYVMVEKKFVGRKPKTSYLATEKGKKAFRDHLDALESIIKGGKSK